ncbi:hypothetical protein DPMN_070854 [Dreissena polymorpha]|uniref:Uncharacterized protein n=1 Tax=Dreissena polymorpha TaxID=45954 RepID=A0A9D4BVX5_DREPO|nr:hypothetical protein DPMN_070854 [Dreissena polymorpha]
MAATTLTLPLGPLHTTHIHSYCGRLTYNYLLYLDHTYSLMKLHTDLLCDSRLRTTLLRRPYYPLTTTNTVDTHQSYNMSNTTYHHHHSPTPPPLPKQGTTNRTTFCRQ